jgi:anhydro-N-acetylmuramic acid kinase
MTQLHTSLFIGLMSGTSLDGIDGILLPGLRTELLQLQIPGDNEIHREAMAANSLAQQYAACVKELLKQADVAAGTVCAIGVHGQTIRHRPEAGYTRQTNNPALLAELTGIDVVADFRSRDIAAGGQGAPLVPGFHQAVFAREEETRVVVNLGGIANISILQGGKNGNVTGFDTGPGNVLLDTWIARHHAKTYDADGAWGASGTVIPALLSTLKDEPFFALPAPKSTGRDLFHAGWLTRKLSGFEGYAPEDVQATLAALTATTLADAISTYSPEVDAIYLCGGGTYNRHLLAQLKMALTERHVDVPLHSTAALGMAPNQVEALAFAWLTYRFAHRQSGNLPTVTGAKDFRILGALYPT